jgi:hypothetical protein
MMSVKLSIRRSRIIAILLAAHCFFILATIGMAQTRRPRIKPTPTPVVGLTGAEIISRADDTGRSTQPLATPTPGGGNSASGAEDNTSSSEDIETYRARVKELSGRVKSLESSKKGDPDARSKRLLLNLDILTRAEQRAEELRKQLFEMMEKENTITEKLAELDDNLRPEMIDRSTAFSGSLRPEEIRDQRRRTLENQKTNLQALMNQIQTNKAAIQANVIKADALVERLRERMEKEIEDTLADDEK